MITCSYNGRFGNNLFQYALTRTIAEHNNYGFGFEKIKDAEFMDIDYGILSGEIKKSVQEKIDRKGKCFEWEDVHFYPYQESLFETQDESRLKIFCGQDARYYNKDKLREWFKVKDSFVFLYENKIKELGIKIDDDLCVMHVRGKDYLDDEKLFLPKSYWEKAMSTFERRNAKIKFIIVTDDVSYSRNLFPDINVYSNSLGLDYYIINTAKNVIMSNSSFGLISGWTNHFSPYIVAPRRWWAYNNPGDMWISSDIWTFGLHFMDKDGELYEK